MKRFQRELLLLTQAALCIGFILLWTGCGICLLGVGDCAGDSPEPDFGVFSETADIINIPDVDVFIGVFTGPSSSIRLDEIRASDDPPNVQEGNISLQATISVNASANGFAGWFVSWGDESKVADDNFTVDMSWYENGGLQFWVKSPISLEVGIRSGNVRAGFETSKVLLNSFPPFARDNEWHLVCVPLDNFEGGSPKADLTKIKILFVISSNVPTGGTGGAQQVFYIDDVRWIDRSCPN